MRKKGENNVKCAGKTATRSIKIMISSLVSKVNVPRLPSSDSVRCHLPIGYAADLTPVVAGKEAGANWNARGMETALDF
jgi:hypothetical protein